MADTLCGYPDRDEVLVTYLYDDMDAATRATFDAHLSICAKCRHEAGALRDVRDQLAGWQVPVPSDMPAVPFLPDANLKPSARRTIPVWAQAAAAMLVLGVSAGLANLDIHYDQRGLSIRTGWARAAPVAPPAPLAQGANAPWRTDLTSLEKQMRSEFRAATALAAASPASVATARSASDDELIRRMRVMIDASEKRQQTELALRVTDVMNHMTAQRNADLIKIDGLLGTIQNKTGTALAQQRATINYLVSTQKQ